MTDVRIHRCTLRVVRRGGWSWGPDPEGLVRSIIDQLRALLEEPFREANSTADAPTTNRRIPHLVVRVPITLLEATPRGVSSERRPTAPAPVGPDEAARDAIRRALAAVEATQASAAPAAFPETGPASHPTDEAVPRDGPSAQHTRSVPTGPTTVIRRLLVAMHASGELGPNLLHMPRELLAAWHTMLSRALASARPTAARDAETVAAPILARVHAIPLPPAAPLERRQRRWLYAYATLVGTLDAPPSDGWLRAALRTYSIDERSTGATTTDDAGGGLASVSPIEPPQPSDRPPTLKVVSDPMPSGDVGPSTPKQRTAEASPPETTSRQTTPRPRLDASAPRVGPMRLGVRRIESALPYLLLPPLARLGWLDALGATCAAVESPDAAAHLALGLALAVLDPPERGWRRTPAARQCAATFAAVDRFDEGPLNALIDHAAILLAPAERMMTRALLREHDRDRGLILRRSAIGWWLLESEGLFPVGVGPDWPSLSRDLDPMPPTRVAIPQDAFEAAMADEITGAGHAWVSDAPPTRGEAPRTLRRRGDTWWTSDRRATAARLITIGRRMPAVAREADEVIDGVGARPPLPRDPTAPLALSLGRAACVGLAALSWLLYAERETSTPVLMWHRFADLSASVRFGTQEVVVTLPLGARTDHLREARILGPVDGVPWLGGRRLELRGG